MSATHLENELEAAAVDAEELASELDARGGGSASLFARGLRRLARDARMSLVAEVEAAVVTRLHLRIETTIRLASAALLEATEERRNAGPPPSQRPTRPPPPFLSPAEIWRRMPASERGPFHQSPVDRGSNDHGPERTAERPVARTSTVRKRFGASSAENRGVSLSAVRPAAIPLVANGEPQKTAAKRR